MIAHTIIVAGLGRCGTSLVMQMLARGGIECIGQWPSFEHEAVRHHVDAGFIAAAAGKAVKVLDPHRVGLPGDVRVIWLDRDRREQARSQVKFVAALMGAHYDRAGRRRLEASLVADTHRCMRVIGQRPLMRLRFEVVIADPESISWQIQAFIGRDDFDAASAAQAVQPRSPECLPGLDMELSLMEHAA